jgi:DNA-binding CsgD family transcriptional regulator
MDSHAAYSIKRFKEKLDSRKCQVDKSAYDKFEYNKDLLMRLGEVENSSLAVYDMNKKHYLFLCSKFDEMIGCQLFNDHYISPDQMFNLMHPDDITFITDTVIKTLAFIDELPPSQKTDYKLSLEFRLRNKRGKYVRFIQQMVVLEEDRKGEIWLLLKVIDLVSEKAGNEPSQRKLLNMKTGEFHLFYDDFYNNAKNILSNRETEILGLISQGLESKEISKRLFISIYTVNNHRQHILSKTKTENTIQALSYAKKIGII